MTKIIQFFVVLFFFKTESIPKPECVIDVEIDKFVKSGRLPTFAKPIDYYITYIFDEELNSYRAMSEIQISIEKSTKMLILHSDWHSIISTHLVMNTTKYGALPKEIGISSICYIKSLQFLVIKLDEILENSTNVLLSFSLIGNITKEYKGIYSSFYKTKDLQKR